MAPDPPSRHAHLCVRERAFAHYYHPATTLFPPPLPPPQLKILYETLTCMVASLRYFKVNLQEYIGSSPLDHYTNSSRPCY